MLQERKMMKTIQKLIILLLVATSACAMQKPRMSAFEKFQQKCADKATRTENDSPLFWGTIYDPAYNLLVRVTPTAALQAASEAELEAGTPA